MDPRIQALADFVINLQECPADQSDDVLAEAGQLAKQLAGLAEAERLHRATHPDFA